MINFTPIPTLNLGFFNLSTHGLVIAVGFLIAEFLARRNAKRHGLSADLVDNAAIIAVIAGLVGARLVYIVILGRGMSLLQMLEVWNGGLSSHGGYVFGILAGLFYFKWKKANVLKYADAVLPYLLIGWAIGRVGCFLNWDSYGKITSVPWAVIVNGEPRHATQLYESLGYLLSFGIVRMLLSLPHPHSAEASRAEPTLSYNWRGGSVAALSLGLFAAVRFVVDFYRDDSAQYLFLSRAVTLAVIALCIIFIVWPQKKEKVVV